MAMQTGIGLSRIIFLAGAGYTGTILVKNGKLADLIGELQNLVKGLENSGETNAETDPIAAQVRWLAQEVRQLATSRQITVLNGSSGQTDLSTLILPAAAVGALGYGYMWWKGLSLSDLMYVTKKNMASAVASLTENLQTVTDKLENAKKHLIQRIQNLDGKMDEQREMSKLIMSEVHETRGDLDKVTDQLYSLTNTIEKLDSQMTEFDKNQVMTLMGVNHLVQYVDANSTFASKYTLYAQEQAKTFGKSRPQLQSSESLGLQGLKSITDGKVEIDQLPRNLIRTASAKVAKV